MVTDVGTACNEFLTIFCSYLYPSSSAPSRSSLLEMGSVVSQPTLGSTSDSHRVTPHSSQGFRGMQHFSLNLRSGWLEQGLQPRTARIVSVGDG